MTETLEQLEQRIRADERTKTAEQIATTLARKVCTDTCMDPGCSTYRYAARIARLHGITPRRVPTQPGPRT